MTIHPVRVRGFTIVELLVVIFIISVLMGLLIPAVSIAKNKAKKAKAATQLAQIEAALKVYKDANGMYPEMDYHGAAGVAMTANGVANNAGLLFALKSVDRENFRDAELRDPYKTLIRYRPAKALPYTTGLAKGAIDGDDPPGADSYQLWSAGPDRNDQVTSNDPANIGDDIVTWK